MTPQRCDQFIARTEFMLDVIEREDVPEDLRFRAAQLLNLHEKATRYIPHRVAVEISDEPE